MNFEKIANYFCDFVYDSLPYNELIDFIKEMILTKDFSFKEINWCFPFCTKERYYKIMWDIIAQFRKEGYSDGDIIKILDISEKDFEEAEDNKTNGRT